MNSQYSQLSNEKTAIPTAHQALRDKVFDLINAERDRQDAKWGRKDGKWPSTNHTKMTVLTEEVGEIAKSILDGDAQGMIDELVQVAAVAVAWLETQV